MSFICSIHFQIYKNYAELTVLINFQEIRLTNILKVDIYLMMRDLPIIIKHL